MRIRSSPEAGERGNTEALNGGEGKASLSAYEARLKRCARISARIPARWTASPT
jgi:hypothetical protein